jgi:hypothetical protein
MMPSNHYEAPIIQLGDSLAPIAPSHSAKAVRRNSCAPLPDSIIHCHSTLGGTGGATTVLPLEVLRLAVRRMQKHLNRGPQGPSQGPQEVSDAAREPL